MILCHSCALESVSEPLLIPPTSGERRKADFAV